VDLTPSTDAKLIQCCAGPDEATTRRLRDASSLPYRRRLFKTSLPTWLVPPGSDELDPQQGGNATTESFGQVPQQGTAKVPLWPERWMAMSGREVSRALMKGRVSTPRVRRCGMRNAVSVQIGGCLMSGEKNLRLVAQSPAAKRVAPSPSPCFRASKQRRRLDHRERGSWMPGGGSVECLPFDRRSSVCLLRRARDDLGGRVGPVGEVL